MQTTIKDLEVTRGDDKKWILLLTDVNDVPYDITGWTVFFTVKSAVADEDAAAKVKVDVTAHTDATNGLTTIAMSAAATSALPLGNYYYDIQVKTSAGKIYTIYKGVFKILYDITIRTTPE